MNKYLISCVLGITCCMSLSHAVLYDDLNNWDITTWQVTGSTGTIPSSTPISLNEITISTKTWSTANPVIDDEIDIEWTNAINQLPELERDAEFLMSLRRLYEQWLTKYQDPEQFRPDNYLSRVDASKMLSILSRKVFGNSKPNNDACAYTDISLFDETTKWQIKDSCQLGIFKSASLFNPNQWITKWQLITVLIRMYDRKTLNESVSPWYKNYIQRATEIWLLGDKSNAWMDEVMSRLDVAKLLYKLRNIYLNKNPITKDENPLFIHIITNSGGWKLYQALIDVNMIRDDYLETLEMKLDTVTYYFGKTKIYNYGATLSSFQVYWYIYSNSESITPIGVGTWRVQKWVIQEWNLIIRGTPQTTYNIIPNEEATLYVITKTE